MIPEYVPVTTSITKGCPEEVETPIGRFLFRHVDPRVFYGFTALEISRNQRVLIATPQKAIVDLLYLAPYNDEGDYLLELRLERTEHFDVENLRRASVSS